MPRPEKVPKKYRDQEAKSVIRRLRDRPQCRAGKSCTARVGLFVNSCDSCGVLSCSKCLRAAPGLDANDRSFRCCDWCVELLDSQLAAKLVRKFADPAEQKMLDGFLCQECGFEQRRRRIAPFAALSHSSRAAARTEASSASPWASTKTPSRCTSSSR